MNYRHIYHAGSFSDVFKHSILALLVEHLQKNEKGFTYIDTHAGVGCYDLSNEEVKRSPEYQSGIARLLAEKNLPSLFESYLAIVKEYSANDELTHYPGSPLVVAKLLRPQDDMILNELHPDDFQQLKQTMRRYKQSHLHHRDAYEFLPSILPPKLRRGLILIDPPYENVAEFTHLKQLLNKAVKRFATGVYVLWYPIKRNEHESFIKAIRNQVNLPSVQIELKIKDFNLETNQLTGCGLLVINPPWQTEEKMIQMRDCLSDLFHQ
jgi:23S rRNA (adenine2030-N6)-methyltransferase